MDFPKSFKEADLEVVLAHSNTLINYKSYREHDLDSLLPNFQNLKSLSLWYSGTKDSDLKSILFPNLQEVSLDIKSIREYSITYTNNMYQQNFHQWLALQLH